MTIDFDESTEWSETFRFRGADYTLREASGGAVRRYKDALVRSVTMGENGKPLRSEGMQEHEIKLVSSCVYKNDIIVSNTEIDSWPNRVLNRLIELVKKNSEMDDDEDTIESLETQKDLLDLRIAKMKEDALGNEQSAITTGS